MKPSPKHRLVGPAITMSLSCVLIVAANGAVANASLTGELLPTVTGKAGPIATVEASPTPRVEVPGVVTVQTPSLPQVQVPTPPVSTPSLPAPPVTTPSVPGTGTTTSTAPVSRTPASQPPSTSSTSSSSNGNATATAASAAGKPAANSPATSSPSQRTARRAIHHAGTQGAAAAPSRGPALAGAPRTVAQSASGAALARAGAHRPPGKASSSNPLDDIGRQIPFPVPVPDWSKPIILALLLLAAWLAVRSRLAGVRARRLERQRARLLGDLDVMQQTLVPTIPRRLGDLSVSVAYRPADGPAAGGDFYDLFVLAPGKVAIVLGDVAGHGRGALKQAALTRYTLRAYLKAGLEPRAALSLAGSVLAEPGEMQFATVVVAIHDSVDGRLTYASAGHPPPICIGFDVPEPPIVCCSAPICCDLPTGRRQTTISTPTGGGVCFFSDGLPEARTPHGLLGRERLVELTDGLDAPDSAPALLQRVRADAAATPDDMVACVISCAVGAAEPAPHVEELEVDRQSLDRPSVGVFLQACGVQAADVAALLARAHEVVGEGGTALLRVERPCDSGAIAAVLPGLSKVAAPTIAGAPRPHEQPLALRRVSA
jgi:Stage II sporulation protein E (SpoIIE)